ncbi:MAG: site-specific integrase [Rhodocyclaceae bacterium]|nr:site-specific integrase [Rhodocyclaceae bacterium]
MQSKSFEKKIDADAWARGIESEMDRGIFVSRAEAESTTLKEALERYQREVTPRKRGAEVEGYRIRALLSLPLALRPLAAVRGTDVARFRDDELARGLAPSTIMKSLALLSHLFETARKEWGIEVDNPVKKISKPKVDNARERRLSEDETRYLLAALDDPGDAVKTLDGDRRNTWTPKIARFAIETAMRQGEILALDWKHVDLERQTAHLPETKNGTTRNVPLSTTAVALLKGDGEVKRLRRGKVFPTTASALKQSFSRAVARGRRLYLADCESAGSEPVDGFLTDLTFHDLRHEATSRLAERLQLHELMRVTGHKDTRMLARYYHPRAEDLARKLG